MRNSVGTIFSLELLDAIKFILSDYYYKYFEMILIFNYWMNEWILEKILGINNYNNLIFRWVDSLKLW